jgi:hypothetical protein
MSPQQNPASSRATAATATFLFLVAASVWNRRCSRAGSDAPPVVRGRGPLDHYGDGLICSDGPAGAIPSRSTDPVVPDFSRLVFTFRAAGATLDVDEYQSSDFGSS